MLKPQDVVLLLKLLASREHSTWSQSRLADNLCFSASEINASIRRLLKASLLRHTFIPKVNTVQNPTPFINPFSSHLSNINEWGFSNEIHSHTTFRQAQTPYGNDVIKNVNFNISPIEKNAISEISLKGYVPVLMSAQEFLIHGVKYFFPAEMGERTHGIATSYGAPLFKGKIAVGDSQIPVWPYAEGRDVGFSLMPLYSSVPKSIALYPDERFYELLVLIDALRQGRARERNIAVTLLKEYLEKW